MTNAIFQFLPIIISILVTVLVIIATIEQNKREREEALRRSAGIKSFCQSNNLKYSNNITVIPKDVTELSHFSYNVSSLMYLNIIYGTRDGVDFYLIDRKHVTGSGKSRTVHHENYCIIHDVNIDLPNFFIRDEYEFFDNIGKFFGGQDINFANAPTFSKKFVLQGRNEGAVRDFFDNNVRRAFLENHMNGYSYEANSNYFMVESPNYNNEVQGMMAFLTYSLNIYNQIVSDVDDNNGDYMDYQGNNDSYQGNYGNYDG